MASRLFGLVRQSAFGYYFGRGDVADAFTAAQRIPNLLQTLFGEGALSASFIPVYARAVARGDDREAGEVAGAVAALLALVVAVIVLVGWLFAPAIVDVVAYGFSESKRDLTTRLVRIFFPGIGLLVLTAWCLGILNSHRRFFLPYVSGVLWNAGIIAALVLDSGRRGLDNLAVAAAWGSVVGSALQLLVQLPTVLRLVPRLRIWWTSSPAVRAVLRNFAPAFVSRGVVQISATIDQFIGNLLPSGAVSALNYAQTISVLPVSLFGVAVSAAELPAMSSESDGEAGGVAEALRTRLNTALERMAFFVAPCAVVFVALGDVVARLLYQRGAFTEQDARWVWVVLAGAGVGLLASTMGRLYSSAFFALQDTRSPLRFALVRVGIGIPLGFALATQAPRWLGLNPQWGTLGLSLASSLAGWVEFSLLRRALGVRIGPSGLDRGYTGRLVLAGGAAAGAGWAVRSLGVTSLLGPTLGSVLVLAAFGAAYAAATVALEVPIARHIASRLLRRAQRAADR